MQDAHARGPSSINTLVLTLAYPHRASYYDDWRDAFLTSRAFRCTILNVLDLAPATLAQALKRTEAIVLLHSCSADTLDYLRLLAPVLAARRSGTLVSFVGNEYNSPFLSMIERVELLRTARCDIIATQLLEEAGRYLYAGCGARIVAIPHALAPAAFQPGPPDMARRIDIGVRGYRYPAFLGDDDRNRILTEVSTHARERGLLVDISDEKRFDRSQWAAFLARSRGTISTEAGSWFIAPDDSLMTEIRDYLAERRKKHGKGVLIRSNGPLRMLARRLPYSLKSRLLSLLRKGPIRLDVIDASIVPFAELDTRFFAGRPRSPAYGKAISSRHFDAIGTRTCQMLLDGRFNDILVAGKHYIAISRDLSNLALALELFCDPEHRRQITTAALEHVLAAHTYQHRIDSVRREIEVAG